MADCRLYVGNLAYAASKEDLRRAAESKGHNVVDAHVVMDRDSGRARGFGFLTLDTDDEEGAIASLNGADIAGRPVRVSKAVPKGGGGRESRA